VITYKTLHNIQFPVFLLYSNEWEYADGLLFVEGQVIDDTNMPGSTMGIRRLQTPQPDLYPLKKAIQNHNGILKQTTKCFIDNNGKPFIYQKTKFADLKYLKIIEVIRKDTASLIRVKGCTSPFTVPRPPLHGMQWAGILHLHGLPWMLYEYSEEKLKDTRRKV
jgi:hypothetical protein